jgi:hypothetical protein
MMKKRKSQKRLKQKPRKKRQKRKQKSQKNSQRSLEADRQSKLRLASQQRLLSLSLLLHSLISRRTQSSLVPWT